MAVIIRDEKRIYNVVNNPAVLFDKQSFVLLKIGERENIERMYNRHFDRYMQAGLHEEALDLAWMDLPNDQSAVDQIYNSVGGIESFLKKMKKTK